MVFPLTPFTITVYSKAFAKLGTVGAPVSLRVTVRHNQQSDAELIVDADCEALTDLTTEGARVLIFYRGTHLLSGPVRSWRAEPSGPASTTRFTFQILDDWWLFSRLLAWPVPGAAITAQNTAEYDVRSGPAETVVKGLVSANMAHSTPTVTVATNLARGGTITALANRFHPLTERTIPAVDAAGIGTTVRQVGSGLVMDVYVPVTYPRTLTESSAVILSWAASIAGPALTQAVAGGGGEGTARVFRRSVDTTRESLYNYSVEGFVDATSTTDPTTLTAAAATEVAQNGPTAGLSVELSETSIFAYDPSGVDGVRVGDLIAMTVGPPSNPVTVTDVLRSASLTWSVESGVSVKPQVGERSDDPTSRLVAAVASIGRKANTAIQR